MRKAGAAAIVAALWAAGCADAHAEGVAFVGVRVFTGAAEDAWLEDATVVVEGARIVAVGPRASTPVPEEHRRIDGRARTLLPGLIDLHVHLFGSASRFDRPVDVDAALHAEMAAAFGVTTTLDLNAPEARLFRQFGRGSGRVAGLPRVFFAGAAISAPGGHGTEGGFPGRTLSDAAGASRQVRQLAARGATVVKVVVDGGGWADLPAVPTLDDEAVRAVVEAAHAAGRKVMVHAVEVARARAAVEAGVDALAHLPLEGALDDEFVAELVRRGTVVVPTLAAYEAQFILADDASRLEGQDVRRFVPAAVRAGFVDEEWRRAAESSSRARYFRERWADALARLGRLRDAGVTLLPGTDAGIPGVFHGDALHRELAAWGAAGIPVEESLHAATLGAARFLGIDGSVGAIEVGKDADLMLVDGDPLKDAAALRRIVLVAVGGRLVEREALTRRVAALDAVPEERRYVVADFEEEASPPAFDVRRSMNSDDGEASVRRLKDSGVEHPSVFLRVEGNVRYRPPSGGFAGVTLPFGEVIAAACGNHVGIRFRARADRRRTIRLLVASDAVRDADFHAAKCVVGTAWQAYHVPFDALRQVGFGRRVRFDSTRVTGIELLTEAGDDGPFRIDLDDVELYR